MTVLLPPDDNNDEPEELSAEQRSSLEILTKLRDAKYDEIAATISRQRGYGEYAALNAEQRGEVVREAAEAVKQWEENTVAEMPPISPESALQRLLREHRDLEQRMLGILDDAIIGKSDD